MKNILIIIPFLASISISAQNISKINSDFELSDSLTYETEVRIYQGDGITNYSSLFRMFKDFSENWTAEFYEHYAQVDEKTALRTEKQTLQSESEMEFVFLNLIRSHILDMPNQSEIHWKLVKRGDIRKVKTIYRGEMIEEFEIVSTKISILDGEGFIIQVKNRNKSNEFQFSNPKGYLKHYPEIDELNYINEILDLIQTEFHIWEK